MDYAINYLMEVLNKIRNNPYGIRHTNHYLKRSTYRDVDLNCVNEKLLSEIPVGIQKTLGYGNRFELIFEYTENDDLYIIVDIINSNEIVIITAMPKDKKRREH
ncbi:MAG: hypothetical protein IJF83_14270 [Methanobrevibacter sp.]|nr:hypothetical protein [Methanobrevibacter sp.]MBQ2654715.1 hypothetical protein [Methanobrevibacter sp.]